MASYLKANEIQKIRVSSNIDTFSSKLQVKKCKQDISSINKPYLRIVLGDITGEINTNIFPGRLKATFEDVKNDFAIGNVLDIKMSVRRTGDASFLNIEEFDVLSPEEYDLDEFVEKSELDLDELMNTLNVTIDTIRNPYLKKLLTKIFENQELKKMYIECPSSIKYHHSYRYGNLEHTIGMLNIFKQLVTYYNGKTILDLDLLYTGIILHDIGKIKEYSLNNRVPFYNEDSILGHLYLGSQIVSEYINNVEDFPKDLETRLIHLILSHHGKEEWGAIVEPQFPEAHVLHLLDMIDSRFKLNY
ncbi:MAG: HD domain-containing protein [Promethearchaeota archaeon]